MPQDVKPGQPARPQLACMSKSVDDAYDKMKGKRFSVELKIDGVFSSEYYRETLKHSLGHTGSVICHSGDLLQGWRGAM